MDFLSSAGGGNLVSQGVNILASYLSGGMKGRPQWRDLEFMNDVTNRLHPDEIKRQGQYLEGIAPSQGKAMETMAPYQAGAYNTYQDETYQRDVDRQTAGIKSMSEQLKMSPWELTGQGGSAAPVPSDVMGSEGGSQGPAFLQQMMPMQLAAMNNKAMLTGKLMDNQTQLKLESIRQGGYDDVTGMGKATQAQIEMLKNQTDKLKAEEQQVDVNTVNSVVDRMLQVAPRQTVNVLGNTITTVPGGKEILRAYQTEGAFKSEDMKKKLGQVISQLPKDDLKNLRNNLVKAADTIIERGAGAIHGMANAYDEVTGAAGKLMEAPGKLMEYLPRLDKK